MTNALHTAIEAQDVEAIRRSAHRLKGECLHFVCQPLESRLGNIEQAAALADLAEITAQYRGVDELCQHLQASLAAAREVS